MILNGLCRGQEVRLELSGTQESPDRPGGIEGIHSIQHTSSSNGRYAKDLIVSAATVQRVRPDANFDECRQRARQNKLRQGCRRSSIALGRREGFQQPCSGIREAQSTGNEMSNKIIPYSRNIVLPIRNSIACWYHNEPFTSQMTHFAVKVSLGYKDASLILHASLDYITVIQQFVNTALS